MNGMGDNPAHSREAERRSHQYLSRITETIPAPILARTTVATSPMPEVPPVITMVFPRMRFLSLGSVRAAMLSLSLPGINTRVGQRQPRARPSQRGSLSRICLWNAGFSCYVGRCVSAKCHWRRGTT
jgi:hypothetical protein